MAIKYDETDIPGYKWVPLGEVPIGRPYTAIRFQGDDMWLMRSEIKEQAYTKPENVAIVYSASKGEKRFQCDLDQPVLVPEGL